MKKNPSVSVLVPIYNVEPYLQRCIDSVLNQDFTDWELILVDDGSPDRCPEICDEYAQKDARIRVVHKENGGLVSARLAGFRESRGEYLVFLDSDDYLLDGAVRCLYNEIFGGRYDVVKARPLRENKVGKRWKESYMVNEGVIQENESYVLLMLHNRISPYLHSAIYRRDLFSEDIFNKVQNGDISIGEDWVTNILISKKVKKAKIINNSVYIYYWNNSSMMASTIISPRLNDKVDKVLDEFYKSSSEEVRKERDIKNIVGLIRANFFWELPFSPVWYEHVKDFISDVKNEEIIRALVERRFLMFINYKLLFRIYSRTYSFLNFILKQKGKRRNVV